MIYVIIPITSWRKSEGFHVRCPMLLTFRRCSPRLLSLPTKVISSPPWCASASHLSFPCPRSSPSGGGTTWGQVSHPFRKW